jgi:hypothetical protein
MLLNPFLSYHFGDGWALSSSPDITANWIASGNKWTVPLGGVVSKVVQIGQLPAKLEVGGLLQRDPADGEPGSVAVSGDADLCVFRATDPANCAQGAVVRDVCDTWRPYAGRAGQDRGRTKSPRPLSGGCLLGGKRRSSARDVPHLRRACAFDVNHS